MVYGLSPNPPRPSFQPDIDPDVPCYRVVEKRGFLDDQDHLWEKDSLLYWEGKPSMALDPINELGQVAMLEYLEEKDKLAQDVAKEKGSAHASLVNAFEARRRIQEIKKRYNGRSADQDEQVPIMGGVKDGARSRSVGAPLQKKPQVMGTKKVSGMARTDQNEGRAAVNKDDKGI